MLKKGNRWLCLAMLLCAANLAQAEGAKDSAAIKRGYVIAQEADRRNMGWVDMSADMRMELFNAHGATSQRDLKVRMLEVRGDGDKSVVQFDSPADVRGTALLTHAHPLDSDDQWQYFPSLRRIKRISSENKSGPFMGSEFAYEDIAGWDLDKFSYRFLDEDEFEGQPVFVLEMTPRYTRSGYTRQVSWLDQQYYRPLKVEYYDRKNALLKTQTFSGYALYLDHYWRAGSMHMVNHQTGKETRLSWTNYRFGNGFGELAFDKSALSHLN
ncbi:outer membrane lipoprotein-sorting protein [Pseudomonas sp. NCHU5208]|uniref:outer membrane lipoprotein-sorting protein n=1 Tax=unclassified Pseudomonas TaxID=196821 RepID=UPI003F9904CC